MLRKILQRLKPQQTGRNRVTSIVNQMQVQIAELEQGVTELNSEYTTLGNKISELTDEQMTVVEIAGKGDNLRKGLKELLEGR